MKIETEKINKKMEDQTKELEAKEEKMRKKYKDKK